MFEVVAKFEGIGRTRCDAELAEGAATEVVDVASEFFLFGAGGSIDHLGFDGDGAVGAIAFASAASDALMVTFGIVLKRKNGTETVGPFVGVAIFGVTFGDFRSNELLTGDLHAFQQRCQAGAQR